MKEVEEEKKESVRCGIVHFKVKGKGHVDHFVRACDGGRVVDPTATARASTWTRTRRSSFLFGALPCCCDTVEAFGMRRFPRNVGGAISTLPHCARAVSAANVKDEMQFAAWVVHVVRII